MEGSPTLITYDNPSPAIDHENIPPNLHHEAMQPPEDGQYIECIGM